MERQERERLQALQQAGYKTNRYAASAGGAGEDARCECVCARTRGARSVPPLVVPSCNMPSPLLLPPRVPSC